FSSSRLPKTSSIASASSPSEPQTALDAAGSGPLLEVDDLSVCYIASGQIPRPALAGISFRIRVGESLGIIGESGSGKSTLALSIPGLLPPDASIVLGRISFRGTEMLHSSDRILRRIRGALISMVFQHPGMALNPFMRVR